MSEQQPNPASSSSPLPTPATPAPPLFATDDSPSPAPVAASPAAQPTYPPGYRPPQRPPGFTGRRYGFLCSYCSSRLEAVESLAGQSGTCPTCGNSIVIPILDYRGRLIDPTSGQIIKQDPHPVHAYAAAGHRAPQIITPPGSDTPYIRCPRCNRNNNLTANNCLGCGLPFTIEGTVGDAVSGTNTWAVASLVLGIVSIPGFCFFVPPILAIIFGIIGLRATNQATGTTSGAGLAIAGIIMGTLGLLGFFLVIAFGHW
jgi:hypothetical protein